MIRVKVISIWNDAFEGFVNKQIRSLEEIGCEIVDIKYQSHSADDMENIYHSAMIMYKPKTEINLQNDK